MIYRFLDKTGKMRKMNTETATLLLCDRWRAGKDQTRWMEIYKTRQGQFVGIARSLWVGEANGAFEMEESAVLQDLALAEDHHRTIAGDTLLKERDPAVEI